MGGKALYVETDEKTGMTEYEKTYGFYEESVRCRVKKRGPDNNCAAIWRL